MPVHGIMMIEGRRLSGIVKQHGKPYLKLWIRACARLQAMLHHLIFVIIPALLQAVAQLKLRQYNLYHAAAIKKMQPVKQAFPAHIITGIGH